MQWCKKNLSRFSWIPWSFIFLNKTLSLSWRSLPISGWWSTSLHSDLSCSNSSFLIEGLSDIVIVQKFGCSCSLSFNRILGSDSLCSFCNLFLKKSSWIRWSPRFTKFDSRGVVDQSQNDNWNWFHFIIYYFVYN